jgi:ADP-L-glycero-D-manno-heptose 6-epimerase
MNKKIIVTGAAGFIGYNIVRMLNSNNYQVVVCDLFDRIDQWHNIKNCLFVDCIFPEQLPDYINNNYSDIHSIVHMGAISDTAVLDIPLLIKNNYQYTLSLWKLCNLYNIKFIYASSAATYGDGNEGFSDDHNDIRKLKPLNPYGWSKQIFDIRALEDEKNNNSPKNWYGLKFFNVFGPGENHKGHMMSVVCKFFESAYNGSEISLFKSNDQSIKDGEQKRDFVWVYDCVEVIKWLIENNPKSGIYNLGSGIARSFLDIVSNLYKSCNTTMKIKFIDLPEALNNKYQNYTRAEMKKLRNAGYDKDFTPIEMSIKNYTDYLIKYYGY